MEYNYIISFIYRGKEYTFSTTSHVEEFQMPVDGAKPLQSEARTVYSLMCSYMGKDRLPCLPHDIIIYNEQGVVLSMEDLKPLF